MRALIVLVRLPMLANEVAATGDGLGERLHFFRWLEDYTIVSKTAANKPTQDKRSTLTKTIWRQ